MYDDPFDGVEILEGPVVSHITPFANYLTSRQRDFILSLCEDRVSEAIPEILANMDTANKSQASIWIDELMSSPKKPKERYSRGEVPDGMHVLPDGTIYKVQIAVHGSGRPYAKKLMPDGEDKGKFVYATGAIRKLSKDTLMPMEKAKEFGKIYGFCCVCGRTLTNEVSIAEGIGPICGGRTEWFA